MASLDALIRHGKAQTTAAIAVGQTTISVQVPQSNQLTGAVPVPKVGQQLHVGSSTIDLVTIVQVSSAVAIGNYYSYHLVTTAFSNSYPTSTAIQFAPFIEATQPVPGPFFVKQGDKFKVQYKGIFTLYGSAGPISYSASIIGQSQISANEFHDQYLEITATNQGVQRTQITGRISYKDALNNSYTVEGDVTQVITVSAPDQPPRLFHSFQPLRLVPEQIRHIDVYPSTHFNDPNPGDVLRYTYNLNPATSDITITDNFASNGSFRVAVADDATKGTYTLTWTATDGTGLAVAAAQTIDIDPNLPPTVIKPAPTVRMQLNATSGLYDASDYFSDADKDQLIYLLRIRDPKVTIFEFSDGSIPANPIIQQTFWGVADWKVVNDAVVGDTSVTIVAPQIDPVEYKLALTSTRYRTRSVLSTGMRLDGIEIERIATPTYVFTPFAHSTRYGVVGAPATQATVTLSSPLTRAFSRGDSINISDVPYLLTGVSLRYRFKSTGVGGSTAYWIEANDRVVTTPTESEVLVSRTPVWRQIPAQTLDVGERTAINLASYASDPDGDALTFELTRSSPHLATFLIGSVLHLEGLSKVASSRLVEMQVKDTFGMTALVDITVQVAQPAWSGQRDPIMRSQQVDSFLHNRGQNLRLLVAEDAQQGDSAATSIYSEYDLQGFVSRQDIGLSQNDRGLTNWETVEGSVQTLILSVNEIDRLLSARALAYLNEPISLLYIDSSGVSGNRSNVLIRYDDGYYVVHGGRVVHDTGQAIMYELIIDWDETNAPTRIQTPGRPVWTAIPNQQVAAAGRVTLDLSSYVTDPGGESLTFALVNPPTGPSITGTILTFVWSTPGTARVRVRATNTSRLSTDTIVSFIQEEVNRAPIWSSVPDQFLATGATITIDISAFVSDPDGDSLTYSLVNPPAGATISGSVITYVGQSTGTVGVTVRAADPEGLTASTVISFSSNPPAYSFTGVLATADDVTLASDNADPSGIVSDLVHWWVLDDIDNKMYAYRFSDGQRDSAKDITLDSNNTSTIGLAIHGNTIYTNDTVDDKIYAYDKRNGQRVAASDFDLDNENASSRGMWTDGVKMWVIDLSDRKIYVYQLANGQRLTADEWDIDDANSTPIYMMAEPRAANVRLVWIVDTTALKLFAYRLADGVRQPLSDVTLDPANNRPDGIFFTRTRLYIGDTTDNKIYAYYSAATVPSNQAPVWQSIPNENVQTNGSVSVDLSSYVSDPDGDDATISYSLVSPPSSATISGSSVTFSAGSTATTTTVTVRARDTAGQTSDTTITFITFVGLSYGTYDTTKDIAFASDNSNSRGMWSDGTTMWVVDYTDGKLYAYRLSDGVRQTGKEITLPDDNAEPGGIWSDGTIIWVTDFQDEKLYAYQLSNGTRVSNRDFDLTDDNSSPRGMWSDGTTMWVVDGSEHKAYAYRLSDGQYTSGDDLILSSNTRYSYSGIWSDGTTTWVVAFDTTFSFFAIHAYLNADKSRATLRDIGFTTGHRHPYGLYSDGTTLWAGDFDDNKAYAYAITNPPT